MIRFFSLSFKLILPLLILAGGFAIAKYLMATGPEARKRPAVDRTPVVEVQSFPKTDYTVTINASGIVRSQSKTNLVAEVGGKLKHINKTFQNGGYFKRGDLLLTLDDTNYRDAINIAQSNIRSNRASLEQLNQEQDNTGMRLKLAEANLRGVQKNLNYERQNVENVARNGEAIQNNIALIQRNMNYIRRNLALAQQNLELGRQEFNRNNQLWQQRLISLDVVDASKQKLVQLEQAIVQQEQALLQQDQQIAQQKQSLIQQDQNTLSQEQRILQQEQAINQQLQNIETLRGQLATFASRRDAIYANIESNEIRLQQEQRNIEKTNIYAPFDGRVLETRVGMGQYVSPNSVLGVIYASDYIEVDMPLTLAQYEMLDLDNKKGQINTVTFTLPFGNKKQIWGGYITGTRAELDAQSRQIQLVARIDRPYLEGNGTSIKIGQYLNANITGRTFKDIYVLPPQTVRQNREVFTLRDNTVHIVPVETLWNTETDIVVKPQESLEMAQLIITPLPQASEGFKVALPGQKKRRGGRPGGGKPGGGGDGTRPDFANMSEEERAKFRERRNAEGGRPEGARPESGRPESGRPESGRPESGRPEGGRPEGGRPEGARPEGGRPEGARGNRPDFANMSEEERARFRERRNAEGGRPEGGRGTRPDFANMSEEERAKMRERRKLRDASADQDKAQE